MATIHTPPHSIEAGAEPDYPTGDGKPLAETPIHRDNLFAAVQTLDRFFADDPMVYVSGNMFVYYQKGHRRKHVSPDVFVAFGVPKNKPRDAYFVWLEAHGPGVVIELTSKSTRHEDLHRKMAIYQDRMPVAEYFLFDPREEYLDPSLQGYRLEGGVYSTIDSVGGRLPSNRLGLELERSGEWLRFYNPSSGRWLATTQEQLIEKQEQLIGKQEQLIEKQDELREKQDELRAEQARRERLTRELEGARNELEEWRRRFGRAGGNP